MSRILPVMPVYVLLFLALVSGRLIHPLCPVSFVIRPKPQYISSIYLSHTNLVRALENSATRFIFSRQKLPCRIWSLWVKLWGRTVHMWSEKKCERWAPPFWVEERDWSPRNIPSHTWITGANLVAVNQTVGAQNLGASETCIPALLWRGASDSRGNTPLTTWVTMPNLIAVVKRHEHTYCYYAPAPNRRGIKRWWCVTSVCLTSQPSVCRVHRAKVEKRGIGRPKLAQR